MTMVKKKNILDTTDNVSYNAELDFFKNQDIIYYTQETSKLPSLKSQR